MEKAERCTFIRTPENAAPSFDARNSDEAYIAHSVMSRRHSPWGMTLDEIVDDHTGQAETDGCSPFHEERVAYLLVRCIEAGLISVLRPTGER